MSIKDATGRDDFRIAVALGSGLSDVAVSLVGGKPIPYSRLQGMPLSSVAGHEGALYHGEVEGVRTLAFAGRVHLYEGHDARTVTHWVRAAADAGCDTIVLTNAAGAIRLDLEVGAPCLISDHLNLSGTNPLLGANDDTVGPRFLDQTEVYDRGLRDIAKALDPVVNEGVYAGLLGPTYETPAEVRMLKSLGADLVGMSTVNEAIMARYLGLRVLGISVVTNKAAGIGGAPLSHEEVKEAGAIASGRLEALLRGVIARLH
ncbi:MAG TPA: purine-nucleoside phosphorylase [Actinomycetota bacterium]|nr:purine-nucleoside phosphorylase [Actinomycetota bacterium]